MPSLQYIASELRKQLTAQGLPIVPLTLFPKGANSSLKNIAQTSGYDVIGLDWCIDPSVARETVGPSVAVQGNMDPNVLYGGREVIEREVKRMSESFKGGEKTKGWIANLGHGITPGVDPEALRFFFECVHKYSAN